MCKAPEFQFPPLWTAPATQLHHHGPAWGRAQGRIHCCSVSAVASRPHVNPSPAENCSVSSDTFLSASVPERDSPYCQMVKRNREPGRDLDLHGTVHPPCFSLMRHTDIYGHPLTPRVLKRRPPVETCLWTSNCMITYTYMLDLVAPSSTTAKLF